MQELAHRQKKYLSEIEQQVKDVLDKHFDINFVMSVVDQNPIDDSGNYNRDQLYIAFIRGFLLSFLTYKEKQGKTNSDKEDIKRMLDGITDQKDIDRIKKFVKDVYYSGRGIDKCI